MGDKATTTYTAAYLRCAPDIRDVLIALLGAEEVFEPAFVETETGLTVYVHEDRWAAARGMLGELQSRFAFELATERLPDRNWNEEWERGFEPIEIQDRLRIRASFHPASAPGTFDHELVIDPRMAFGTGHHATTYMMCERLLGYGSLKGKRILDFGCGTGVLAILAARLCGAVVDAIDIEPGAVENTLENATTNDVKLNRVVEGQLADLKERKPYDVILANINRNVLLDRVEALYERAASGGRVLLSGLLDQDAKVVTRRYRAAGFSSGTSDEREGWRALEFYRT